ncbi:DUF6048 family protein [Ornithobacterium rhinotracheale]|uniref:DUF6048 family protein n=1 Tax=Ornithobacterium rhinotracheale TaxID=28251 RepID=UPI00129C285C|nr:DUF6048 family protein [Ornithobacterium rhinotracheale]UOH77627.1 DUF6048 family protein [Ornithobacterium rhinotracheale]
MKLLTKALLTFCLLINISSVLGQEKKPQEKKERKKIFVGIDLAQPAMQFFTDKMGYEATVVVPVHKKWYAAAEAGYEKSDYDEVGWKGKSSGFFANAGANWIVSQDKDNPNMNFYMGGRVGFSLFNQEFSEAPVQGYREEPVSISIPSHSATAVWFEPLVGTSVPIGNSNFYINANTGINILLFKKTDQDIDPIAIPGFGKNNNGLNLRVVWAIGYAF